MVAPATPLSAVDRLCQALARQGFAFVPGAVSQAIVQSFGPLTDGQRFVESWSDLTLDTYMADGGRYRRRRHAVYAVSASGDVVRQPHQPHYQTLDYNPLNGGIARLFDPVAEDVGAGASMRAVLRFCHALFQPLSPATPAPWHVEVHQFRIEARAGEQGRPTPEGMHRDGVDFALVLLIARRNIASGTTRIQALDGTALGSFTLTDPFDAAIVDDHRVAHGVTPVEAIDPERPAHRDVLVVTFARDRAGASRPQSIQPPPTTTSSS